MPGRQDSERAEKKNCSRPHPRIDTAPGGYVFSPSPRSRFAASSRGPSPQRVPQTHTCNPGNILGTGSVMPSNQNGYCGDQLSPLRRLISRAREGSTGSKDGTWGCVGLFRPCTPRYRGRKAAMMSTNLVSASSVVKKPRKWRGHQHPKPPC